MKHWVLHPLAALSLAVMIAFASSTAQAASRDPEALARMIEARASATSFEKLEEFGHQALTRNDREGLNRLYHVAWTFRNQGDYEKATLWNQRLTQAAERLNDTRYKKIAHLNDLYMRFDAGNNEAGVEIRRIYDNEPDWFVGAHAVRLVALDLNDQDKVGEALNLLTAYDARIPADDASARTAQSGIWDVTGLSLMKLNALGGAADAFNRFEIELSDPDYPRPDFDSIYNLTRIAVQLGDHDQASHLYGIHHRLAVRANNKGLSAYDAYLCVMVARGRADFQGVLNCLQPYGADLGDAAFLANNLLTPRAIAFARTGRIAEARRDLATFQRMIASGAMREEGPSEVPHVEAELLFAEGRTREAFERLEAYYMSQSVYDARRFSAGIGQISGDLQQKLDDRRLQLHTASSNADLQKTVIDSQRWLVIIAGIFLLTAFCSVIWLARQAVRLRDARRRADSANLAKSEFLANMSHEIRTPLNGVVAMADALGREDLPPRQHDMIEIIRSSGETLERLLSDILDSAKIEAGQLSLETAPFALHQMVQDIGSLWRARSEDKGLLLQVDIDPTLPLAVAGDVVRVRQVLGNLVSNAVKFTSAGQVSVKVVAEADNSVLFTVTDSGVGFDDTQMSRIFSRFQQADGSITRQFGGTGLGLAISRDLVDRMGGTMGCNSQPGQGATFWFRLPLPMVEMDLTTPEAPTLPTEARTESLRILLADDHPANRKVVEVLLSAVDVEIIAVENGQQAVDAFRSDRFDLVLMDMQMPVMDGLTATREIRQIETATGLSRTPLLMLTANAMAEHVAAGAEAGADGHLSKPITSQRLFEAIETALAGAEPAHESQVSEHIA